MPRSFFLYGAISLGLASCAGAQISPVMTKPLVWKQLPPIPDREGFAGSYAGVSGNALLVAGGANFPDKRPWEGGTKIWYDRVFVLEAGLKDRVKVQLGVVLSHLHELGHHRAPPGDG